MSQHCGYRAFSGNIRFFILLLSQYNLEFNHLNIMHFTFNISLRCNHLNISWTYNRPFNTTYILRLFHPLHNVK